MSTPEGALIVAFYEGTGRDERGRSLEDILKFDDDMLERTHDFIQWLFPTRERSGANPQAPRLDDAAIARFLTDPNLRSGLRRSFDRMLAFYGMIWSGKRIVPGPSFPARNGWLTRTHNHLRLTRMLTSLRVLADEPAARALYRCLCDIDARERRSGRQPISGITLRYWSDAVHAPLQ